MEHLLDFIFRDDFNAVLVHYSDLRRRSFKKTCRNRFPLAHVGSWPKQALSRMRSYKNSTIKALFRLQLVHRKIRSSLSLGKQLLRNQEPSPLHDFPDIFNNSNVRHFYRDDYRMVGDQRKWRSGHSVLILTTAVGCF